MAGLKRYKLIDGNNGQIICIYRALAIACRDAARYNKTAGIDRYYIEKPDGSKLRVRGE